MRGKCEQEEGDGEREKAIAISDVCLLCFPRDSVLISQRRDLFNSVICHPYTLACSRSYAVAMFGF